MVRLRLKNTHRNIVIPVRFDLETLVVPCPAAVAMIAVQTVLNVSAFKFTLAHTAPRNQISLVVSR